MGDFFGGGSDTHTTTTAPPEWATPYMKRAFRRADRLYGSSPLYPGQPYTPDELAGMEAVRGAAGAPALVGPSTQYAQDVIGGRYLTPEALREAADPYIGMALQGVRTGFEGAGGRGGSMEALATGEGVTRALADVYGRERGMQQGMALASPALEAARYGPGNALMSLGGFDYGRQTQRQQEPWQRYQMSLAPFGGNPSATMGGTQTQPVYQPSPFSQIAGLGMAGLGLAGNLGWRPFGTPGMG